MKETLNDLTAINEWVLLYCDLRKNSETTFLKYVVQWQIEQQQVKC